MSSRFSEIAHAGILVWSPVPEGAAFRRVDDLDLPPAAHVLDVGCGRAELLIRLLARTGARGVGVDRWGPSLEVARRTAAARGVAARLELRQEEFDAGRLAGRRFDLALCIGSTHAAGGFRGTLRALRPLLPPGGVALVGEGHWRRDPDPEYLAFLGSPRESLGDGDATIAVAVEEGFALEARLLSSERDFDVYEDRYAANVEAFAAAHPDDPDAGPFLDRIRAWRAAYHRWGRDTLGFGLYTLRRVG